MEIARINYARNVGWLFWGRFEKFSGDNVIICLTFSIELGSSNDDVILFSTANTTPSAVWIATAVDPS